MKTILVTGANGYIGSHVVTQLLDLGYKVLAAAHSFNHVDSRAERITTNIFSQEDNLYNLLGSPDICLHMAWQDGFKHNSDLHMQQLSKHYSFIKQMIDSGIERIAIMGTMHEIGFYEGEVDENTPCNPLNLYGIAKNALRSSSKLLADNKCDWQWIRAFYIYGDDEKSPSIFGKIVQTAKNGMEQFPFTTGTNKYDFIPLEELAKQIAYVVIQNNILGIINCCSGKPVSLATQIESFIKERQLNIKLNYGVYPERKYDSKEIWGSAQKIQMILSNIK